MPAGGQVEFANKAKANQRRVEPDQHKGPRVNTPGLPVAVPSMVHTTQVGEPPPTLTSFTCINVILPDSSEVLGSCTRLSRVRYFVERNRGLGWEEKHFIHGWK